MINKHSQKVNLLRVLITVVRYHKNLRKSREILIFLGIFYRFVENSLKNILFSKGLLFESGQDSKQKTGGTHMIKNFGAAILAIILIVSMTSCKSKLSLDNSFEATSSQVKKFATHILDNEYTDAIALYNSEISGNSELEIEASNCIAAYLSEIKSGILSGELDNSVAEAKENTVKKYVHRQIAFRVTMTL